MSQTRTLQVGRKTYTGAVIPRSSLHKRTRANLDRLERQGFKFDDEALKVPVTQYDYGRPRTAHSFFIEGTDTEGNSVIFARIETSNPVAGRTAVYIDKKPYPHYGRHLVTKEERAGYRAAIKDRTKLRRHMKKHPGVVTAIHTKKYAPSSIRYLSREMAKLRSSVEKAQSSLGDDCRIRSLLDNLDSRELWLRHAVIKDVGSEPEDYERYRYLQQSLAREKAAYAEATDLLKRTPQDVIDTISEVIQ